MKLDVLTLDKKQGGLGITKLSLQNSCLQQKWLWRFCYEDYLYGKESSQKNMASKATGIRNTEEFLGTYGCSVWKIIRRLWPLFHRNIALKVGNGLKIDFWGELWIGEESLKSLFPDLFILSQLNRATTPQVWRPQGWNLVFGRALYDWEIDKLLIFWTLNNLPGLSDVMNNMEASQQGHVCCEVMLLEQKCYPYTVHNMALEAYVENQDSPEKSLVLYG